MILLGISAFYHDAAAAILVNGELISAAQEERFSRKKHDSAFPSQAIQYCLEEAKITINEVDAIAFYDKPFLKFERLLETYYSIAPKGLISFLKAMPIWLKQKLFIKRTLRSHLKSLGAKDPNSLRFFFPEHHLSHAASAFYPSGFQSSAILTIDGVGEWATASICKGQGKGITVLKELHFPDSIGLLYSAFTYYLGFRVNSGEYKLMGLAPYGRIFKEETEGFCQKIKDELVEINADGSIILNQSYFNYRGGLKMIVEKKWETLFGIKRRAPESRIENIHCQLAFSIQKITEEIVEKLAIEAKRISGSKSLCLAGGVALNCVANGQLIQKRIFERVFIQPASGDAGGAVGAVLAVHNIYFNQERNSQPPSVQNQVFLGPGVESSDINSICKSHGFHWNKYDQFNTLSKVVARLISKGAIVGWVQDRMEFGPRALGNRSILADPRNPKMQEQLNLKIKFRESFRPFAPAVLEEEVSNHFNTNITSPYMLQVHQVKHLISEQGPSTTSWKAQLSVKRSQLSSITHVDGSARIQTVNKVDHPKFYRLISDFKNLTQIPVLINTSFNVRGEPIVCTAKEAYDCFMKTEMDYMVIGNYLFTKKASFRDGIID